MKIAILTLPAGYNYGCLMQNFALQTVLRNLGHDVKTIRFNRLPFYLKMRIEIKRLIIFMLRPWRGYPIRTYFLPREEQLIYGNLFEFSNQYIEFTRKVIARHKKNKMIGLDITKFDAIIVGSDQVWQREYGARPLEYFLDFIDENIKIKRLVYAASYANFSFSSEELCKMQCLVNRFAAISCREKKSAEYCSLLWKRRVEHVLDPTLLLTKEKYIEEFHLAMNSEERYLLAYILDMTEEKRDFINTIAKKYGLKVRIMIGSSFNPRSTYTMESPIVWLENILNADFVITDSFHGTIFSIIFERQFLVINNSHRGTERFRSLLDDFKLQERLLLNCANALQMNSMVDYTQVQKKIARRRDESLQFLISALN